MTSKSTPKQVKFIKPEIDTMQKNINPVCK